MIHHRNFVLLSYSEQSKLYKLQPPRNLAKSTSVYITGDVYTRLRRIRIQFILLLLKLLKQEREKSINLYQFDITSMHY